MGDLIFDLLPVLAFLTGTLLGGLIVYLFTREQTRQLQNNNDLLRQSNSTLRTRLDDKSLHESRLSSSNAKLEILNTQLKTEKDASLKKNEALKKENKALIKQNRKLRSFELSAQKDYVNDYQQFLSELEKSIKKARKKSGQPLKQEISKEKKKPKDKKSPKGAKSKNPKGFDFYKNKYAGKSWTLDTLNSNSGPSPFSSKKEKDLTYLEGIDKETQNLLKEHNIHNFKDLARTQIAILKGILSSAGTKFERKEPLNWPIQARLAEKGQWEILEEYKNNI